MGPAMQRTRLSDLSCSIARTMDVIGEWWTPLILRDLFVGVTRFEDLRRDLGIASNVLTDRLATLAERGIVRKRQYQDNPPRFEYELTEKGRDLFPALLALVRWGDRWEAGRSGPPALLVHEGCKHVTSAQIVCAHCGDELTSENVTAVGGPGGKTGPGTAVIGPILEARAVSKGLRKPARTRTAK
jgi:DNA-binding HxlR family transcriptional regulator